MTPKEREKAVRENHQALAPTEGQTFADPNEKVCHCFIAFFNKSVAYINKLDGRKIIPIRHGATNGESFLQEAADVCKEFVSRDPRFTVLALSAATS
uniref:UCH catalytic domain-containing protein n=1 Tax=Glossina palpalis gambiensis TaxID=67801 RepID=A0A1B0BFL8_9MUSC